jgi:hypothetical protein
MSYTESSEQLAISRLFDLVRDGRTEGLEFDQLDLLVYERLAETYAADDGGALRIQTVG